MIRCNRRSLLRFGAVATALLLALPALADEIEPEPYVEEAAVQPEPEPAAEAEVEEKGESEVAKQPNLDFDQLFDLIILRPVGLVTTVLGGAFFLPAALLTSPQAERKAFRPLGSTSWPHRWSAPSIHRSENSRLG